jgi:adenylosuccinate synthase
MHQSIGSTAHGCGAALVNKIARDGSIKMAKDVPELQQYICDTVTYLNKFLDAGAWILLEGTQGSMLSITTSPYYPYCTSRDTNVSNWLSEAGISPLWVHDIYGVFRAYPIRVAGNSGPTGAPELTWDDIRNKSGNPDIKDEKTTVTKKIRRIFEFSKTDFERAWMINTPTKLCINFADYIDVENSGLSTENGACIENLSDKTKQWLSDNLSPEMIDALAYIGTGPSYYDMIVEEV